jgi:glucosamine 6-phosphate synthetase-like amidotransferase/phosphosugar isomerase protein
MLTTGVVECRPLIGEALEALLMTNVDQSRNLAKSVTVE